ncbi:aldehyde dehydrogenase family protein [Nocardia sp. NBC_00508]|uniref:aldehyde dehydrogenase family protein n=1 Tax=Nocardia sp. NBC_00508 TaxID=2975992 RepID=UPI002E823D15|nr:aldehyde dehydrogenase family protein [Nocardia sp. NBC_00508]WUD70143.1 aldehyde dehydrogenase family protein [Nocardia sp. NBC_00508]
MIQLDALGPDGTYRAHRRVPIADVAGTPLAQLSLVPGLFVQRSLATLRNAPTMPADERAAALARAGHAFATATLNGLAPRYYEHLVSRVSGTPISAVREATRLTAQCAAECYRNVEYARPVGATHHWTDPLTRRGSGVWIRRGDVFSVHAAGNHPGVHILWLEALAMGYRVAVRPSQREPFTPHRLIAALREAGFSDDQAILLPTDHTIADQIIRSADLAMVYGGDDVVDRYRAQPTILPQGPGRSKILLTEGRWEDHLDTITASISHHGGTACVNTTAVFVQGDPTPVAKAIAQQLSTIPSLPPHDDKAVLPARPLTAAQTLESYVLTHAKGATAHLGGEGIVDVLADGSAVLRPAVFELGSANAPQTGIEVPFPCVWIAPWEPSDGIEPLRHTLALTAITDDHDLIDRLVGEPTIRNVYIGDRPTYQTEFGLPHDSYLADFLMRTKTVIRA